MAVHRPPVKAWVDWKSRDLEKSAPGPVGHIQGATDRQRSYRSQEKPLPTGSWPRAQVKPGISGLAALKFCALPSTPPCYRVAGGRQVQSARFAQRHRVKSQRPGPWPGAGCFIDRQLVQALAPTGCCLACFSWSLTTLAASLNVAAISSVRSFFTRSASICAALFVFRYSV